MRAFYLFLVSSFFILCIASCRKPNEAQVNVKGLAGSWNWAGSSGGIIFQQHTPANTGSTEVLQFFSDGSFKRLRNDTLDNEGHFTLSREVSIYDNHPKDAIRFSSGDLSIIMSLTADSLILADNAYDGYTSVYYRN